MIKHIVMWKLHDFADGASKSENAHRLKQRLEALPQHMPEMKFAEVGINFNASDAAFDVVLVSEFESREALQTYQKHPEHQKVIAELLEKIRSEKTVVDYET